jgi:hypothetical protein
MCTCGHLHDASHMCVHWGNHGCWVALHHRVSIISCENFALCGTAQSQKVVGHHCKHVAVPQMLLQASTVVGDGQMSLNIRAQQISIEPQCDNEAAASCSTPATRVADATNTIAASPWAHQVFKCKPCSA